MKTEIRAILGLVGLLLAANGLVGTALPIRMAALQISDPSIAALGAFAYGGGLIGAPLAAATIGRLGNGVAFMLFASLFGTWAASMMIVQHPIALQLLRSAAGVSFSALMVVIETRLNSLAPQAERSRVLARYMITFYAAQATGAALTGVDGTSGMSSLALAAVVLLVAATLATAKGIPGGHSDGKTSLPRLHNLTVAPEGYAVGLLTGAMLGCFYGYAPVFALHTLANPRLAGAFMAAAMIGGMGGLMISGRLADRFGVFGVAAIWASLLAGASAFMTELPAVADPVLIGTGFIFGALLLSLYPFGSAIVNAQIRADERVSANALYIVMIGVGGILGPMVGVHAVRVQADRAGFAVISASAVLVVLALLVRRLNKITNPPLSQHP